MLSVVIFEGRVINYFHSLIILSFSRFSKRKYDPIILWLCSVIKLAGPPKNVNMKFSWGSQQALSCKLLGLRTLLRSIERYSPVVQWWGLCASTPGIQVWSLVGEVRSSIPHAVAKIYIYTLKTPSLPSFGFCGSYLSIFTILAIKTES